MEEQKRNPAAGLSESEQVQVRRQKLADLQAAGNDPFTLTKFPQDAYSADLKEEFKELPNETDSGKLVALAGRMMSKRVMGKASFAHLRDDKGDIQLYVRRDELGDEAYAAFKKLDVGDIIGVKGEVFRTKTGELSVRATELTLLAKSLRPLPEKFHGLTDTEMRYRQRYVDLIANPEVKDTFIKRSRILKEIRAYLDEKGFLEVDTPILTPFEIGASARPFYTHHNTLNMDMVLRIETELYLKRLIVGGMDRVYEVGRIFRNEGMDPKHNPEFTTIELYQAFTDFHGMMELVEELYEMEGMELRKNKIDSLLGPGINIHRNPLNGRNFEYFSEDPYLTGTMAAAQLKGMGKYGVTGTIKHFACNNQEFKRHDANAIVSERALREIYLKGFEIAVKQGGAYSIMSTYGPVNGLWTAGSYDLLTTILRKEWGYRGIVMTDWWAKINEEGEPGSGKQTIPMVRAQNDIYMVTADAASNSNKDNTAEGLADGRLTRAQLMRNAANICCFLLRSVAMERLLGREEEECTELHSPISTEGAGDSGQVLARLELPEPKTGEEIELPLEKLSTKKGTGAVYQLRFPKIGRYELVFRMSSTLGPLAQLPISVFLNNTLQQTVTINGTEGKVVEQSVTLAIRQDGEKYMKLYFGESGIDMHRMFLRYVGKNDIESFRNE